MHDDLLARRHDGPPHTVRTVPIAPPHTPMVPRPCVFVTGTLSGNKSYGTYVRTYAGSEGVIRCGHGLVDGHTSATYRTVSRRDDAVLEGIVFVLVPQWIFLLHGRRGGMPHRRCDRAAALSKPSRSLDVHCASIAHPPNTDTHIQIRTHTDTRSYVHTCVRKSQTINQATFKSIRTYEHTHTHT